MELSEALISTNQNRALLIRKFLTFLTSTNHNQSFTQNGVSNVFDIKQPSIPSQVLFVRLTNQNEVFKGHKTFLRSQQNYVFETSQPITFIKFFLIQVSYTFNTKVR